MAWGLLAAGVAASVAGSYLGGQAQKKATNAANAGNLAAQQQAQLFLEQGQANAVGAQKKGIFDAEAALQAALGTAGTMGTASKSSILKRERQALGATDASAANRGLYHSTSALNAGRGVRADTDLALAGVDEATAGLITQIHQRRAQTALAGQQGLAGIYSQFAGNQAQTAMANQHVAANVGGAYASAGNSIAELLMTYKATGDK